MLWAFYTCGTSLIPLIIRIVLLLCAGRPPVLQDFRVELFFLSIIFFVDAIKNYQAGSWMGNLTVFLLIVCSTMYSLVMAENLALLKANLSNIANISGYRERSCRAE